MELVDNGTLIDAVNRAEKRAIIDSALDVRMLKELRNDIAHEYLSDSITKLQENVFEAIPKLLKIVTSSTNYCQKYLD